jgi:lipid-A-disaccharide synthase
MSTSGSRYYVVAGEASGDLHGANLIRAMHHLRPGLTIRGWGGNLMAEAGAEVVKHYSELAFMGFVEVLRNLPAILRNFCTIKQDILAFQPDALVLIDYPGFNLRLAKWAKKQGIRVSYYISPQIWAWHASRAHQIKANVDQMIVILPFEQAFYKQYGMDVHYVGHPLLDAMDVPPPHAKREKMIVMMPGSRRQEVVRLLPTMLLCMPHLPNHKWVVAAVESLPEEIYHQIIDLVGMTGRVEVVSGQSHDLMRRAALGLVKSGTSTLEAALSRLPMVVCYRGSSISYAIAKRVIRVAYISLVNLILDRTLVPELIQSDCTPDRICAEMDKMMQPAAHAAIQAGYAEIIQKLGHKNASVRAAELILITN